MYAVLKIRYYYSKEKIVLCFVMPRSLSQAYVL